MFVTRCSSCYCELLRNFFVILCTHATGICAPLQYLFVSFVHVSQSISPLSFVLSVWSSGSWYASLCDCNLIIVWYLNISLSSCTSPSFNLPFCHNSVIRIRLLMMAMLIEHFPKCHSHFHWVLKFFGHLNMVLMITSGFPQPEVGDIVDRLVKSLS